ncbi:hypothetical protein C8039_05310 [Halogeometricum sp. wsp3]|nr:hypothetical protein C8039_05310 [Halogeometricum sp. wsp3]
MFQVLSILLLPAGVGLALLADDIILLTSTRLIATQSASLVPILLIGFIIKALRDPLEFIFNARQENQLLAIYLITGSIINVSLNIILIPRIGLVGAAWATSAAHIVILFLLSYKVLSYIHLDLDYKMIMYSILSSVVMFIVISHIETQDPLLNIMLLPILGGSCYFVLLYGVSRGQVKSMAENLRNHTQ